MQYQTIIVAFPSTSGALAAVQDLKRMGVPAADIKRHPADPVVPEPETGVWTWLFGKETSEREVAAYEVAVRSGGVVVSVRVMDDEVERVRNRLRTHAPLDIQEPS
jgi:hypothetical protein